MELRLRYQKVHRHVHEKTLAEITTHELAVVIHCAFLLVGDKVCVPNVFYLLQL